ncbi:response regulator, partial [Microvirga sp. 3-52]|nr:response regulator [Microvirga sp. 3-52]
MKVVLVDDEQLAVEVLEIVLGKFQDIEIVGKYTDPELALQEITDLNADVIFLDMEMGEFHGLQLAEKLIKKLPNLDIVFVTAHAQFALEAFEVFAVDYLLKPVSSERLGKTIDELRTRRRNHKNILEENVTEKYLLAKTMGSFNLLCPNSKEIKWRTQKVKELFLYLWHHNPTPIHRSRILDDIWQDYTEDRAAALMHTTLYQLRKLLREIGFVDPVKLINEHYIINVPVKSDFHEIERIIGSTKLSAHLVENMVELYKGNFLEEEDYHWALSTQYKMKNNYLNLLEKYALQEMDNQQRIVEICLVKMLELE